MRKLILLVLLVPVMLLAQVPQAFDFQGVAREPNGDPLVSQNIGLQLSIIVGTPGGSVVYVEGQSTTTSPFGLFNVQIGNGTPISGSFAAIDWVNGAHYLKVEYDPAGGTNYIHMGTTQLLSVPYALVSGSSADCFSVSFSGDTLHQGNGCYVIIPGISGANGGCADADGDGFFDQAGCGTPLDCDDSDPAIHPGATEVCDGADNDCDGQFDEDFDLSTDVNNCGACGNDCGPGFACVAGACTQICFDNDGDGFTDCDGDCDDTDPAINPDAIEICGDGVDNNCDGQLDEEPTIGGQTWYQDLDGDGHGDPSNSITACSQPVGYVNISDDCDDTNASIHPGANEICEDGLDNDCDGSDAACSNCADGMQNGSETDVDCGGPDCAPCGQGQGCVSDMDCGPGLICQGGICVPDCPDLDQDGFTTCDGDCDDTDPSMYPGATELCNGTDDDCDGQIDEDWNFDTDPQNCGGCNLVCSPMPNSTPACVNGSCMLICDPGYADCDGNFLTGCETNVVSDDNNCGGCGISCPPGTTCQNGQCVTVCPPQGQACDDGNACTVGDTEDGACNCVGTPLNCDDGNPCTIDICDPQTGCVFSPVPDGTACPGGSCQAGSCLTSCPDADGDGWTTCAGDCNDSDPSMYPGATELCNGNDDDCDSMVDEDWNFQSDPQNCGGCNLVCSPMPNSTPACVSGSCTLICDPGFVDCDGNFLNGCETNINSDQNNCGGCGVSCPVGTTCQNGVCVPISCTIHGDCPPNFYCSGGQCVPKKASGAACGSGDECLSGSCVSGQCQ